jgi:hypothetical protein
VSLAICSVGGNAGVLERGRPARDFGGKVDKRSTGESHMVISIVGVWKRGGLLPELKSKNTTPKSRGSLYSEK